MASTNNAYGPRSIIYDEGLQPVSLHGGPFNSHHEPNPAPEVAFFEHTGDHVKPQLAENSDKEAHHLHSLPEELSGEYKQNTVRRSSWRTLFLAFVVIAIIVTIAASVAVTQVKKRSRNAE